MGSQLEAVLLHKQNVTTQGTARGHLTQGTLMGRTQKYLETFLIVMTEEGVVLLASSRWRPGMLLNLLQQTGQPPQQRITQPQVLTKSGLTNCVILFHR